jgi:hypothetical protein
MAGVYHNSAYITDGSEVAYTVKCTFRMILILREILFHPGDLGFKTIPTQKVKLER